MPGRRMSGPPLPTLDRSNPDMYDQDGLRTMHGHDFADDRTFSEAYDYAFNATKADPGHHGPWRVQVAMWAAKTALRRRGHFVECGTARAFVSTAILKYTNWNETSNGRHFYLVDTFEGIVEELLTDREREGAFQWHGTRYQNNYPDALQNVSPFKNVQLVKSMVPNILPQIPARQVAYLRIDMNSAVPEGAALEYFWPKAAHYLTVVPDLSWRTTKNAGRSPPIRQAVLGGVVLLDDYAYAGYEPLRDAHNESAKRLGVSLGQSQNHAVTRSASHGGAFCAPSGLQRKANRTARFTRGHTRWDSFSRRGGSGMPLFLRTASGKWDGRERPAKIAQRRQRAKMRVQPSSIS